MNRFPFSDFSEVESVSLEVDVSMGLMTPAGIRSKYGKLVLEAFELLVPVCVSVCRAGRPVGVPCAHGKGGLERLRL